MKERTVRSIKEVEDREPKMRGSDNENKVKEKKSRSKSRVLIHLKNLFALETSQRFYFLQELIIN